jgi:hypothetical protein
MMGSKVSIYGRVSRVWVHENGTSELGLGNVGIGQLCYNWSSQCGDFVLGVTMAATGHVRGVRTYSDDELSLPKQGQNRLELIDVCRVEEGKLR